MYSEKIKLFFDSDKYWDKYWDKIDNAKNHIFIVTYDIDNKTIANITLRKLLNAAERGVKIVFIAENINYYLKKSLEKHLKNNGVIILKPNPLLHIFFHIKENNLKKFFNRTHQKVTLIDEDVFVGSLNIASEYSGIQYGSNKFIDMSIYVKRTICFKRILKFFKDIVDDCSEQISSSDNQKLKELFDSYDLKEEIMNNPNAFEEFIEEKPPLKSEIQDNIYELLENANESITIIQPYYTNLKKIEDLLIRAVDRGVKVKIITAEKRDQPAYKHMYNSDLFHRVLTNGVDVYEYLDKFLHMKIYYIDKKIMNLGSFNNDVTSFILNNEANYLIKKHQNNVKVFQDLDEYIEEIHSNCRKVYVYGYKSPIRLAISYWWHFFIWSMENLVANREHKYK